MRRMISIAPESPRQPDVLALMQRADEYALGLYPAESYYALDVAALERPNVTLLVARDGGELAGIVALVDNGDGTAEIKRMFVAEQQRGRGVAAALLAGSRLLRPHHPSRSFGWRPALSSPTPSRCTRSTATSTSRRSDSTSATTRASAWRSGYRRPLRASPSSAVGQASVAERPLQQRKVAPLHFRQSSGASIRR
jgi:GNAT superfamily N-acetyltransferase